MEKTFNLKPRGFQQKSFYGKAKVTECDGVKTLRSYKTDVCKIVDGKLIKLWNGYSATTMNHIRAFCDKYGVEYGGKKWWDSLPCDNKKKFKVRVGYLGRSYLMQTTFDNYSDADAFADRFRGGTQYVGVEEI